MDLLDDRRKIRFIKNIDLSYPNGCWPFKGSRDKDGYGRVHLPKRKKIPAHRVSWILFEGEIPEKMLVCHSCDNPSCVNPNHLFIGTHQDNMDDCVGKGRKRNQNFYKKTCPAGHEYNSEHTYLHRGKRHCKTCQKIRRKSIASRGHFSAEEARALKEP